MTQKCYFDEPLVTTFSATILENNVDDAGRSLVLLDQTYFYPAGGGQDADRGTLAGLPVLDVRKVGDEIVHIVEGQPADERVQCQIDRDFRIGNMQAHTGQHILSAAFVHEMNAVTRAVKMTAHGLSTVDLDRPDMTPAQLAAVEHLANTIIMEDRAVRSHFVAPDDPKLDQLRRAVQFDKVTGDVRLVEIDDFDLVACAGTHFTSTGQVGLLKLLKAENYKGGTRVHFAAGYEALAQFQHYQNALDSVSNLLSAGISDVHDRVSKLLDERATLQKQIESQREALLRHELADLRQQAVTVGVLTVVKAAFADRSADDLRGLANLLTEAEQTVAVLAGQSGADCTVIVASSADSGVHAGNLLKALVTAFGGRGGGRDRYAQGVLKGFDDVAALLAAADEHLL